MLAGNWRLVRVRLDKNTLKQTSAERPLTDREVVRALEDREILAGYAALLRR